VCCVVLVYVMPLYVVAIHCLSKPPGKRQRIGRLSLLLDRVDILSFAHILPKPTVVHSNITHTHTQAFLAGLSTPALNAIGRSLLPLQVQCCESVGCNVEKKRG